MFDGKNIFWKTQYIVDIVYWHSSSLLLLFLTHHRKEQGVFFGYTNFNNISQEKSKQQDENQQILSKNPKLTQTISSSKPRNINDSDILSIENKLYSLRNKIKKKIIFT